MSQIGDVEWLRPSLLWPPIAEEDDISFQHFDIDHYEGPKRPGFLGPPTSLAPCVRIYGVTSKGHSIMCHVHGFLPYFYVNTQKKPDESRLELFRVLLNERAKVVCRQSEISDLEMVVRVEYVADKRSVYGYSGHEQQHFLKITVATPRAMQPVRDAISAADFEVADAYERGSLSQAHQVYEANINYELRFMSDLSVHGCGWLTLPINKYQIRDDCDCISQCQIECDINYTDLIVHPFEGEWTEIAPLRLLCFDIETLVRGTTWVNPKFDKIVTISSVVVKHGIEEPFIKCVFTLRSCAPIAGAVVKCYNTEAEMLMAWSKFVASVDPDIITGYNIKLFDISYMIDRAEVIGLTDFSYLGRISKSRTRKVRDGNPPEFNVEGRVVFDLLRVLQQHMKLKCGYKLNDVSYYFLEKRKVGVHFTENTSLFNGDERTRHRLAAYCLEDSILVAELIEKLKAITSYIELSRIARLPMRYLLIPGKRNKFILRLLREANKHNYLLPEVKREAPMRHRGKKPEENDGILYSSVIMKDSLCYTTLLTEATIARHCLQPHEYIKTPAGHYFKRPQSGYQTVVPQILESLHRARERVKDDIRKEIDQSARTILSIRQLALELCLKSVFDFFDDQSSELPCYEVAKSVAASARVNLVKIKQSKRESNEYIDIT